MTMVGSMEHDQFTDLVAERADVPHERAGELIWPP